MLTLQMVIYGFSFMVLLFLLADSKTNKAVYSKTSAKYRAILIATMALIFFDAITLAIDGIPGKAMHWAGYALNSILFSLNLVPISLWLSYLDDCIVTSETERKRKRIAYIAMNVIDVGIVVVNLFYPILFSITKTNQYVRGWAIYAIMGFNLALFFAYLPSLLKYKKFISGRIYELILALGICPIVGAIIQMLSYGTPLVWPMMALVALAAHILVEREEIRRDCLTGLLSRTQLESRLQFILDRQQVFSLIMLDIDRFKSINDTFGHEEGDTALRVIANLLSKSIKQVDSAYRYAGDEFFLIIESEFSEAPERVVERLNASLAKYNKASQKPYELTFSCGIVHHDGLAEESVINLISKADDVMYQNKKRRYNDSI